jgi:hypothetical protein
MHGVKNKYGMLLACLILLLAVPRAGAQTERIWTKEMALEWQGKQPWLLGCNFIPSTAVNELEMWQKESFDPSTIDRELGWASEMGMNAVRVFLHLIPWQEDSSAFKERIDRFLRLADKHRIKTLFVLFDDCWNQDPQPGPQPPPRAGVHNSRWVQCPGRRIHNDSRHWGILKEYVQGLLSSFARDKRILGWDLYNEPGNGNYGDSSLHLLKKVFEWAWSVRPDQPLTAGIWFDNPRFYAWQTQHSDIISFHNYNDSSDLVREIRELKLLGRPMLCTEFMARPRNSRFQSHLPVFRTYRVGAFNWGFVSGRTNTIYAWDSPVPGGSEPAIWFHDILRKDGSPYDKKEVQYIRQFSSSGQ